MKRHKIKLLLHQTLSAKLMLLVMLLLLTFSITMSIFIGVFYAKNLREQKAKELSALIETVAQTVDTAAFEQMLLQNEPGGYYEELKQKWNTITSGTNIIFLYLAKPVGGQVMYLAEGSSLPGYESSFGVLDDLDNFGYTFLQAMKGKTPPAVFYNTPKYGYLLSVYRPFYNSKGEIIAVIGGDLDASAINGQIIKAAVLILFLFLAGTIPACIIYYCYLRQIILRPLAQATALAQSIYSLKREQSCIQKSALPEDEIENLLKSYSNMNEILIEIIHELERILI